MKRFTQASDNQLIQAYTNGNATALELLINRHKDKIFTSIYFMVKDKYLAEDLFQEAFIKIIDTINNKRYNEEGKFLSWATRIAHNLCIDHFRKIKNKPTVVTSDAVDIFEFVYVNEDNAEQKIMRKQTEDRMYTMIDMLPADQREVIVLRHFADMSFKEIAAATNCSINTALGRMRYGLINLRKMMVEKQIVL